MPPCSVQPKDNNAAHVKAEAARAVFRACFMGFLRCAKNVNVARVPTSPCQIEFRLLSGNVDNVHVTADARHRRPHFCNGSFTSVWPHTDDFRSTPINRHRYRASGCLKGANNGPNLDALYGLPLSRHDEKTL